MQIGSTAYPSSTPSPVVSLPARPVSSDSLPDLARAVQAPVIPVQPLAAAGSSTARGAEGRLGASAQEAKASTEAAGRARAPISEQQREEQERQLLQQLAARDREVRSHEQAHAAVGGRYAGAPSFTYTRGPDGRAYARSGEVSIDVGPIPNDPEATLRKMELVQRAALAPAEPSSQDLRVAAQAQVLAAQARAELAQQQREARRTEQLERREQQQEEDAADEPVTQPLASGPDLALYLRLSRSADVVAGVDLRA